MPFITIDLLRRRAEHNEGCLSDLKEIALHQQDLERISVIGDACRQLEIIYMSNNYIPRIQGLIHLKFLKYLNLAINNIKVIEGLEGCEMLEKLDLTLNFIADFESVKRLRANAFLKILHLTGNPCTDVQGYRAFVIEQLPQLTDLDGTSVARGETIAARQDKAETEAVAKKETAKFREIEAVHAEMRAKGIDPFPAKFNEQGERVYGHSAEERVQMLREQQEEEQKRKDEEEKRRKDPNSISGIQSMVNESMKPEIISPAQEMEKYGRYLMRNEAKLPFTMLEDKIDGKKNGEDGVIITVEPGRFISTSLIDIDLQIKYVRFTIKGKVLQLVFPVDVAPDKAKVQRSQTTGQLKIQIPVAQHIAQERNDRKKRFGLADDDCD
jgi:protein TilB